MFVVAVCHDPHLNLGQGYQNIDFTLTKIRFLSKQIDVYTTDFVGGNVWF